MYCGKTPMMKSQWAYKNSLIHDEFFFLNMISKYAQTQLVVRSEIYLVCGPIFFKARNN